MARRTTPETPDEISIAAARAGDLAAFEELVGRHEATARAVALAGTGEPEAARDVTQEAFLDAYRLLHQLREPRAFAGWLRTIVRKHTDRWRRQQRATSPPDEAPLPQPAPQLRSIDSARLAGRVRDALAALPHDQSEAASLFYLGDRSAAEIAADLDLPLGTIKKRLYSARRRLRKEFEMDAELHREFARPDLASEVRFFLAVRAGRRGEVERLLDAEPELVRARENWSRDEALRDGLPYADRATALARAAAQGDAPMLELLIARGAAIDAACDCAAAETALFNAVGAGETRVVTRLLRAGADPDRASGAGTTPLHLAAHAGGLECAELLLAHGARADLTDNGGRTAADWARERGHRALAERLAGAPATAPVGGSRTAPPATVVGRAFAPDGNPLDGAPAGDWRRREGKRPRPVAMSPAALHTGIKAIDLACPLPRDGNVEVRGSGGHGLLVTLGELSERVAREGGLAVWCGFELRGDEGAGLRAGLRELGVEARVALVLARKRHGPDAHERAIRTAYEIVEAQLPAGAPGLVVLLADETHDAVVRWALAERPAGTTLAVARARLAEPARGLAPFAPPFDARLIFDPRLAAERFYPAVDIQRSESRLLDGSGDPASGRHAALRRRAREALAADGEAAARLRAYLTQPFHTTTAFTARPGADVELDTLLGDLEVLLSSDGGRHAPDSLRMIGSLPSG